MMGRSAAGDWAGGWSTKGKFERSRLEAIYSCSGHQMWAV